MEIAVEIAGDHERVDFAVNGGDGGDGGVSARRRAPEDGGVGGAAERAAWAATPPSWPPVRRNGHGTPYGTVRDESWARAVHPPACARMTPGLARAGCSASQSATLSGARVDDDEPVELATAMTFVDKNKTSSVFALANPHVLLAAGSTSGASPSHRVTPPTGRAPPDAPAIVKTTRARACSRRFRTLIFYHRAKTRRRRVRRSHRGNPTVARLRRMSRRRRNFEMRAPTLRHDVVRRFALDHLAVSSHDVARRLRYDARERRHV